MTAWLRRNDKGRNTARSAARFTLRQHPTSSDEECIGRIFYVKGNECERRLINEFEHLNCFIRDAIMVQDGRESLGIEMCHNRHKIGDTRDSQQIMIINQ